MNYVLSASVWCYVLAPSQLHVEAAQDDQHCLLVFRVEDECSQGASEATSTNAMIFQKGAV